MRNIILAIALFGTVRVQFERPSIAADPNDFQVYNYHDPINNVLRPG